MGVMMRALVILVAVLSATSPALGGPLDPRPDGVHHARPLAPGDAGEDDPGEPLADPEVEVVHGCRAQPDPHLPRPGLRVGDLAEPEHLGPAVLLDHDRAHRNPLPPMRRF